MEWKKIITNKGWRFYPLSIEKQYLKKISSGRTKSELAHKVLIDFAGMIMANRTYQTLNLCELDIKIPSQDFEEVYLQLKNCKPEILSDEIEVFKIRGWLAGIVMTRDMRTVMMRTMEEVMPSVQKIAQDENDEFVRRIDQISKNSGNTVVSIRAEELKKSNGDKVKPN